MYLFKIDLALKIFNILASNNKSKIKLLEPMSCLALMIHPIMKMPSLRN